MPAAFPIDRSTAGTRGHCRTARYAYSPAYTQADPLLDLVYQHFKDRPYDFEEFTADLWRVSEPNAHKIDVTRPWRDGGRDAVGEYLLGPRSDPVAVEFGASGTPRTLSPASSSRFSAATAATTCVESARCFPARLDQAIGSQLRQ